MMSALGGGRGAPKADGSTDKLREFDSDIKERGGDVAKMCFLGDMLGH